MSKLPITDHVVADCGLTLAILCLQQSPLKDLLAVKQREYVADMVNSAIIAAELEAGGSGEMPLVGIL